MIENTDSHASRMAMLAGALTGRSTDDLIREQEKAGQEQFLASDHLPTEMDRPAFEALGFTFAQPAAADPLFAPATMPAGWTRQGSDHDMWSYLLDEHGRRRASIFYKAAFYSRSASMNLIGVGGYVREQALKGQPIITDDTWATPAALTEAARRFIEEADDRIAHFTEQGDHEAIAQFTDERAKYAAVLAQFATPDADRE
ncbi:hypothetical protein [Streptomyces niveus]|uniref:hypothetical protein n=1 Tax=Streptomyces niveus TaxID=193462 RepID=UPI003687F1A5